MKYRKLDENGDMTFGAGLDNYFIDSAEVVAQSVLTRLRMWLREWYLDTNDGTPYYQQVLGKHTQTEAVQAIYRRIRETAGVNRITEFSTAFDPDTRRLRIEVTLDTVYGEVRVNARSQKTSLRR